MKVLHLDLYYKLPDDFTGTFEDAILDYVEYRRSKGYPANSPHSVPLTEDMTIDSMWETFLIALENTEYKSIVGCSMSQLNPYDNTWIDLLDPVE